MSFSMFNSFSTSVFRLRSLLVIPQIFLNTDISNTRNFLFCSSFSAQASELYSIIARKVLVMEHL